MRKLFVFGILFVLMAGFALANPTCPANEISSCLYAPTDNCEAYYQETSPGVYVSCIFSAGHDNTCNQYLYCDLPLCEQITGNAVVDSTCCVSNNYYQDPVTGKDNHGAYVSCVADKVVELRLDGLVDKNAGKDIVHLAGQSDVNKPANVGPTGAVVTAETATTGSLDVVTFLAAVLSAVGVAVLLFKNR